MPLQLTSRDQLNCLLLIIRFLIEYCIYVSVFLEKIPDCLLTYKLSIHLQVVDTVLDIHLEQKQGDILVFLTGQSEIEKACDMIFEKSERVDYAHDVRDPAVKALMVLPVYGSMATGQ